MESKGDIHEELGVMYDKVWLQVNLPVCLLIVLANSIALAVFLKRSFLVKKSIYLLVNLTISDLLVGVSMLFGTICSMMNKCKPSINPNIVTVFEGTFASLATSASIITLSFLSVERVFAVFWPFHHRFAKRWHYFTAIAVAWFLSIARAVSFSVYYYFFDVEKKASMAILSLTIAMSLVTIVASYSTIWIKLKFFTKFRRCRTIQENSKLTKTLFIVTLVSVATFSPLMVADAALAFGEIQVFTSPIVFPVIYALYLSNSMLNVVVYLFRMPEFRKELTNTFCMYF